MKPEDVPAEWVDLAEVIYDGGEIAGAMRRALAAVIPLVRKKEREACAWVAEALELASTADAATCVYKARELVWEREEAETKLFNATRAPIAIARAAAEEMRDRAVGLAQDKAAHYRAQVTDDYDDDTAPARAEAEAYGSMFTAHDLARAIRALPLPGEEG